MLWGGFARFSIVACASAWMLRERRAIFSRGGFYGVFVLGFFYNGIFCKFLMRWVTLCVFIVVEIYNRCDE